MGAARRCASIPGRFSFSEEVQDSEIEEAKGDFAEKSNCDESDEKSDGRYPGMEPRGALGEISHTD